MKLFDDTMSEQRKYIEVKKKWLETMRTMMKWFLIEMVDYLELITAEVSLVVLIQIVKFLKQLKSLFCSNCILK